jgi:hypothetical protein
VLRVLALLTLFIFTQKSYGLPIDWHGTLGFDTTIIDNYRRLEKTSDSSNLGNAGSYGTQEVPLGPGAQANANWQSYIFRLIPNIVVNDSASIKSEISSGYARGGRLGDSTTQSKEPGFANALYPYSFDSGDNSLVINKLYIELFSDTATYLIGRHSNHYGLGAVVNDGEGAWDRHSFIRDGITLKIKLGSFAIEPFWARIGSEGSLTKATRIKELGFSLVYDSIERDMAFGILYAKKANAPFNSEYKLDTDADLPDPSSSSYSGYGSLGKTDVKLTDLYFRKTVKDFTFGLEVPILSGNIGSVFGQNTKYKAKAFVVETKWRVSDSWAFNLFAGKVDGEDGGQASFEGMYLNPNYQVANLLFRYNMRAISNPDGSNARSVYDSYINNTTYLKFNANYRTEKWEWDFAFIWAKADEAAEAGQLAFNHATNKAFSASYNQEDDLGYEVDVNFNYSWNNEISIGGAFGYLFTGDYFGYTNTSTTNSVDNSYILQLKTAVKF